MHRTLKVCRADSFVARRQILFQQYRSIADLFKLAHYHPGSATHRPVRVRPPVRLRR
jgi:hypothetical protein